MTLKDNLKAVKTELNTEEQFLEKFIKSEKFIKKYKFYILGVLVILLLYFAINFIVNFLEEKNIKESNEIYASLIQSPKDKEKLANLKEKNINLYTIFLMNEFDKEQNNAELLNELNALYKDKNLDNNLRNILALNLNQKSFFLKDFNKILEAYKLLEEDKIEEANILLSQIKTDSTLGQIAKNLKHYQGINQ